MFSRKSRGLRPPRMVVQSGEAGADLNDYADFTVSGYGAPSAAIVLIGSAVTTANPSSGNSTMSIGFWDGVDQCCESISFTTGTGRNRVSGRFRRDDKIGNATYINDDLETFAYVAEWTLSAITDGVRITMTLDNTSASRYFVVILFWDVWAKLYTEDFNGTTEKTYTPGFHPSLLFGTRIGGDVDDSYPGHLGFGMAHVSSEYAITQLNATFSVAESADPSVNNQGIDSDKFLSFYIGDTAYSTIEVASATATTFVMEWSTSSSSPLHILAIGLDDPDRAKLAAYDTKSSSGTQAYTGVGFKPTSLITFNTGTTALDSWPTAADGCLSIGATTGVGEEATYVISATDNVSTWSHSVRMASATLYGHNGSHSTIFNATLNSFDSDGFTLDYDSSSGTYKFIALSIG